MGKAKEKPAPLELYTVQIPALITSERLGDVLCGALEGGSNYWCEKFQPDYYPAGVEWGHETIALGVPFTIWFDGETAHVDNNKARIEKTLSLMAEKYPRHFDDLMNENDDADTSDVLFQTLCFAEVVYG